MASPTTTGPAAAAQDSPSKQEVQQSTGAQPKDGKEGEESIGHLSGEYSCVYNRAKGKLLVGSEGLFFEGFFFFVQQRYCINWKDVRQVQKPDPGIIDIICQNGERGTFSS
eukprot:CAMPEP_0194058392 /NCGR_PEP_ID=MMETSP0009_2-20130614/66194_1 /TAXON_ID=210454 /ORGANISM="Grammatophora oceanica, Strain CCMP 410" /LENGTH=110 /DNA_ID=CAMNT_0038708527 /DNA_START=1 /DNA_END=330 /DNA_ORIENTATION=+